MISLLRRQHSAPGASRPYRTFLRIPLRVAAAGAVLAGAATLLGAQDSGAGSTPAARGMVLVELFTSEGCPHCPDADAMLERMYSTQPVEGVEIVPVEEHVDYWDRAEWVDHFSSPSFTERQKKYADAMDLESIYTPQMVVDGVVEFAGNNESRARATISALRLALGPTLSFSPANPRAAPAAAAMKAQVQLQGKELTLGGPANVYLILTEDKLTSRVGGGSNAGESWKHSSVARWFYRVGQLRAEEKNFSAGLALADPDPGWRLENLRLIALVQEEESRKVVAVGLARWQEVVGARGPSAPSGTVSPAAPATSKSPGLPRR